jgi:hypothetical protein
MRPRSALPTGVSSFWATRGELRLPGFYAMAQTWTHEHLE